ncbi:MAG: ferrous iron transporter B [Thermodesulfobacteriota bacterium]|nr:ferrous iron transporter B [Thermodesulfobacteriota bacterium]
MSDHVIGVVGNPNCGKTTLFNALTGTRQRVGNWPGVTVERKSGEYVHAGRKIEVVDLPGIYSLSAASLDEQVARNYILSCEADLIVNIIDASNLERNLYLTMQLLEMRVPVVLVLNMMDMAKERRVEIDIPLLSRRLGCPVVPMVASREKGVDELKEAIDRCTRKEMVSALQITYPAEIQKAVDALIPLVEDAALQKQINARCAAVKLLEGDEWIASLAGGEVLSLCEKYRRTIEDRHDEETDILMADSRYGLINQIIRKTVTRGNRVGKSLSDRIDGVVLNRTLGIPVFLAAMYLMFMVTINIGGAFIDFFDIFTGIFAKEAVVGTLDAMYTQIATDEATGAGEDETGGFDFWGGIGESFVSIPENLMGVAGTLLDPLGIAVGDVSTLENAADEQEVAMGTFGAMVALFDGQVGAFAYLLFILLYFPCVAAIAAVYRETTLYWTVFAGAWTTGLAYMAAVLFYQAATIGRHPVSSLLWIGIICAVFLGVVVTLRRMANAESRAVVGVPEGVRV